MSNLVENPKTDLIADTVDRKTPSIALVRTVTCIFQSISRESVNGKPSSSSATEPSTSRLEPGEDNLKPEIVEYKPDRSSIMRPTTLEVDSPTKRRRGRPKSVSNQDSDKGKSRQNWEN